MGEFLVLKDFDNFDFHRETLVEKGARCWTTARWYFICSYKLFV